MSTQVRVDGAWQATAGTIAAIVPELDVGPRSNAWLMNGFNLPDFGPSGIWSGADCDAAFAQMVASGATTVALFVEWYQQGYDGYVISPDPALSPSDEDVAHIIVAAHRAGLNVYMRPTPQAAGGGVWRGDFHPGYQDEFHPIQREFEWHESYQEFLLHYARLSERYGVEFFSIGSELVNLTNPNLYAAGVCDQRWRGHVTAVREVFSGLVAHDFNWSSYSGLPEFTQATWIDALDVMGVDAYWPLWTDPDSEPAYEDLMAAWPIVTTKIRATRLRNNNIPYWFAECGYPSRTTGFLNPASDIGGVYDDTAQHKGYNAAFDTFRGHKGFLGIAWWLWMPQTNIGGDGDLGLVVQGKPLLDELPDLFRSVR